MSFFSPPRYHLHTLDPLRRTFCVVSLPSSSLPIAAVSPSFFFLLLFVDSFPHAPTGASARTMQGGSSSSPRTPFFPFPRRHTTIPRRGSPPPSLPLFFSFTCALSRTAVESNHWDKLSPLRSRVPRDEDDPLLPSRPSHPIALADLRVTGGQHRSRDCETRSPRSRSHFSGSPYLCGLPSACESAGNAT